MLIIDFNIMNVISLSATLNINLSAAISIAIRIKMFQRNLQTLGLGPSSPYTALMEIWIESAALIVLFGIVYQALIYSDQYSVSSVSFIFMECLIHINVRVAYLAGRTGNLTFVCNTRSYRLFWLFIGWL